MDILSTTRLLSLLPTHKVEIMKLNLKGFSYINGNGKVIYPRSLIEIATSDVDELSKCFQALRSDDLQKWGELWNRINSDNTVLRILGANGDMQFCNETYFDKQLAANCTNEFQKSARVIGNTLVNTNFATPDWFLNWRLKQLAIQKKIEFRGELKEMRDYEVKTVEQ